MSKTTWLGSVLVGIAIMLTGCATAEPPATVSVEVDLPPESVQASVWHALPTGPDVSLGVVLSQNTKNNLRYLQQYQHEARGGFGNPMMDPSLRAAAVAYSDPDFIPGWMGRSFNKHFPNWQMYESLEQWQQDAPDLLAVVNVRYEVSAQETVALVETYFYDAQLRPIGLAKGEGEGRLNFWARAPNKEGLIQEEYTQRHLARVTALQRWEQSVERMLAKPAMAAAGALPTDDCVRAALHVQDLALRQQAIQGCGPQ